MQRLSTDIAKYKQSMSEQLSQYQKLIADPSREFEQAISNLEQVLNDIERRQKDLLRTIDK
jgi:hypothetical protein